VVATTDATGSATASFTFPRSGVYTVTADYAGSTCDAPSTVSTPTPIVVLQSTSLTLPSGQVLSSCGAPVTLSATLLEAPQGLPVAGESVVLRAAPNTANQQSCTAVTDANGVASCTVVFNSAVGVVGVSASFTPSQGSLYIGSVASNAAGVNVPSRVPQLTLTGARVAPNGQAFVLSAVLESTAPVVAIAGRTVTLTVGGGGVTTTAAQACSGVSGADGSVSCTIASLNQLPLGPGVPLSAAFAGDSCFAAVNSAVASVLVFAYPSVGVFVIGDRATAVPRTFYSTSWFSLNPTSVAPQTPLPAFRGFAYDLGTANGAASPYPVCGGYVTSNPVSDLEVPASVPSFMGVVVASNTNYNPASGPNPGNGATNDCASNPCQNGGTCNNIFGGGYWCRCVVNRHGQNWFVCLALPSPVCVVTCSY
jgi:hypothetical protein